MDPIEFYGSTELKDYIQELGSRTSLHVTSVEFVPTPADGEKAKNLIRKSQALSNISLNRDYLNIDESAEKCPSLNNNYKRENEAENDAQGSDDDGELQDGGDPPVKDENQTEPKRGWRRFIGLGLSILASLALSLSSLIVKYFRDYHPYSKCVWRFNGLLLAAIPMMFYSRWFNQVPIYDTVLPIHKGGRWKNVGFLLFRSAAGFGTIVFQFYALQYITLADQLVIASSQPVFVTIVAYFMLGEKTGVVPILMCLITIGGVFIVTRPPILTGAEGFDSDVLTGTGHSLASMAMSVFSIVLMRRLEKVHFTLILFTFAIFSLISSGSLAGALGVFQWPQGENHIILAIIMTGLVLVSQTATTIALKHEQAGLVSVTRASTIVFAFGWQFMFLGVVPDKFSIIGASIITFGILVVAIRKWISLLPEKDKTRKRFRILLK